METIERRVLVGRGSRAGSQHMTNKREHTPHLRRDWGGDGESEKGLGRES